MHARARAALAAWLVLLLLAGWLVHARLSPSGDLRLFMPTPRTAEQRLLMQQFGEGPGARVLLLALAGAPPAELAQRSRTLREALGSDPQFTLVANGDNDPAAIAEHLLPARYLLSSGFDAQALDAATLRAALQQRLQDLGSPAATLVEPWIARDPTLEMLRLAEAWTPAQAPQTVDGVWFDRAGERALLLVETRAAGFDPESQQRALAAIERAFGAGGADAPPAQLEVSGPGAFSVLMRERTGGEAGTLGAAAGIGMMLLLALAYRSMRVPLLAALPLASAALAGLGAVALWFGSVHGITLAFGFTLIGVAQDYPVHLFSHRRRGESPTRTVRGLWRTLATGVGSTCLAYLSFLAAGVEGLAQLACFTIAGLLTAVATTTLVLPRLLPHDAPDVADGARLQRLALRLGHWPDVRSRGVQLALAAVVAAALAVLAWSPRPWWENNLSALTPVPPALLQRDQALRGELGAPDVRHVLVVEAGASPTDADEDAGRLDALLARSATLQPGLDRLVREGVLAGYDLAARYLPDTATQLRRQRSLPDAAAAAAMLQEATVGLPFRAGVFGPFLADLQAARAMAPLRPADLDGTALAARVHSLLRADGGAPVALVALTGVRDLDALQRFAQAAGADVHLLDLRTAAESLAAAYRERVVLALLGALVLLALSVRLALGDNRRALRVLAPMLLASLLVPVLLHVAGIALTLFHLVALILGAGLGLDYALFVDHAGANRAAQRRTLHALLVCAGSTLLVFALLALSQIPVLRAIGSTVGLCVAANLVLAWLLVRDRGAA